MRTIAVFHSGSDEAEALWYCELADLGGKPVKGDSFIHAHTAYEVVKTYVVLGARDQKGALRTGTDKLLELLNTLFGQHKALSLYARLRNIGSGDAPETTSGGILLPKASLAGDFDNLVFCTVKSVRSGGGTAERDYSSLLQAASKLTAARIPVLNREAPAVGLKRIRLQDGDDKAPKGPSRAPRK